MVGTFGVLYHFGGELSENGDEIWAAVAQDYTALSAYAFMIFNLLCAPCFAAMGAIKREMNNGKWTAIAIGYMCLLAYCASPHVNTESNKNVTSVLPPERSVKYDECVNAQNGIIIADTAMKLVASDLISSVVLYI